MKYADIRRIKAMTLKASVDKLKSIEIKHYNEPVFHIVSKSEFNRLTKDKEL